MLLLIRDTKDERLKRTEFGSYQKIQRRSTALMMGTLTAEQEILVEKSYKLSVGWHRIISNLSLFITDKASKKIINIFFGED